MQELLELAKQKGFEPKTLSTSWTFNSFFGGKKSLINETCILLLLHEIQYWIRGKYKIHVSVNNAIVSDSQMWFFDIFPIDNSVIMYKESGGFEKFNKALQEALYQSLKLD